MVRHILIGFTLLLAADDFSRNAYAGSTVTGHVLQSLTYALTPALIALIVAGSTRYIRLWRGKPDIFTKDFNWLWGIFLCLLIISHVHQAIA